MKRKILVLVILFVIIVLGLIYHSYLPHPGPRISKNKIPSDIPDEVREQIEKLYSDKVESRVNAAVLLGRMGEKASAATPFLIKMFDDSYWVYMWSTILCKDTLDCDRPDITYPVNRALIALGKIKDKRATEPLIEIIRYKPAGLLYGISFYISRLPNPVKIIVNMSKGEFKDIKLFRFTNFRIPIIRENHRINKLQGLAITALGNIGDKRAVEPLISVLDNDNFKRAAIQALGKIGDPKAVKHLIGMLEAKSLDKYTLSTSIFEALGKIGDKSAIKPLIKILEKDDISTRAKVTVTKALIKLDPEWPNTMMYREVLSDLRIALADTNYYITNDAADGLISFDREDSLEVIFSVIKNNKENYRRAILALRNVGKNGRKALTAFLKDEELSTETRNQIIDIFKYKKGGYKIVEPFKASLKEKDAAILKDVEVLGLDKDTITVGVLLDKLKSEDEHTKRLVMRYLASKKDKRVIETLVNFLFNGSDIDKVNAARALAITNNNKAVEPLVITINNKENTKKVRVAAVMSLGKIATPEATNAIIASLNDIDIKNDAIVALAMTEEPSVIKLIIDILKTEENKDTIKSTIKALKFIVRKSFGNDKEKWLSWWEENKDKYLNENSK
jgi:HEAT repeat protein